MIHKKRVGCMMEHQKVTNAGLLISSKIMTIFITDNSAFLWYAQKINFDDKDIQRKIDSDAL